MTFVSKNAKLNCISKYDISKDSIIQMLNILSNIEKSQDENQNYTVERAGKQDPPVRGAGYEPVPSRRSI